MGWLEVLAQLKRVLPLLTRVAPLLESFLAVRGSTRGDTEAALERFAGDVKGQLAATALKHDSVAELLDAQAVQIAALTESVRQIHAREDRVAAGLLEIETAISELSRMLRKWAILLVALLLGCLGLLIAILLHRTS